MKLLPLISGAFSIAVGFIPPIDGWSIACFITGGIAVGVSLL